MVRVGIAGMGYGAAVHLPAFLRHPGVEVAALADNGSGRAAQLRNQFGLNARVFGNGEDMVHWLGLDAVSLAVPALQQPALVRAALASGKHVLCEKPFGTVGYDIAGLGAVATDSGLVAAVGYEYRYDKALRRAIQLIRDGEIGEISRIDVRWLTGGGLNRERPWSWRYDRAAAGGVLVDWCCHVIDYCHAMLGESMDDLWCSTSVRIKERIDGRGGTKAVTAPDNCELQGISARGVSVRVTISNVEPAGTGHSVEVFGTKGRLYFHHAPPFNALSKRLILQRVGEPEVSMYAGGVDGNDDGRTAGFHGLAADFVTAIDSGSRPALMPTFEDGEAVWRVLSAAQRSADQGCRVMVAH